MDGERRWARRDFRYGDLYLDRGQIVTLVGAQHDERLVRLGYVGDVVDKKADTYKCSNCGAEFIDTGSRTHHGDRKHGNRELNPYQEDEATERRERMLDTVAPLHMDKTVASQKG